MQESFKIPSATFPTLTGSIVTFNSQYAGLPLKSHKIALTATQSGSGIPSPDNVRPIIGYNAINISHSDADTSNPTVHTIQIGSTVYGGEYDARTGVLTISRNVLKLVDNNKIALQSSSKNNNVWRVLSATSNVLNNNKQLCNIATYNVNAWALYDSRANTFVIGGEGNLYLQLPKSVANTLSDFITFITNNDIYFYTEMATPITIQLPPCPIDTLEVNNIWADTGDTTLQYPKFG